MERKFWVNPGLQAVLGRSGFHTFTDFLKLGTVIRKVGYKENVQVTLGEGEESFIGFLKRHGPSSSSPGLEEWENHKIVAALGIPVPEVLAAGGGPEGSFIMTAELRGAIPLDQHLEEASPPSGNPDPIKRKHALLSGVADITRTLHEGGLCHRDLYLCHFFVRPGQGEEITLIDLQRVRPARPLRFRWIVKDLAALDYSASPNRISRSDRLRFFLDYLGRRRLDSGARRLIRRIVKKTRRIRRHDRKGRAG
ncbi:MAG: lipopolysaccharide kinase InaA family protein [Planctomycetota bacterium]|jgi:hypothetical protein